MLLQDAAGEQHNRAVAIEGADLFGVHLGHTVDLGRGRGGDRGEDGGDPEGGGPAGGDFDGGGPAGGDPEGGREKREATDRDHDAALRRKREETKTFR